MPHYSPGPSSQGTGPTRHAAQPPPPFPSPPTSSYMTSSLGRAEAPQAVLLPICSCSPCLSAYLGLHYKELLYGALKGSSHSLLFLLLASCFVKADFCIQHRTFCAHALAILLCSCFAFFSFCLCVFAARYLRFRISCASFFKPVCLLFVLFLLTPSLTSRLAPHISYFLSIAICQHLRPGPVPPPLHSRWKLCGRLRRSLSFSLPLSSMLALLLRRAVLWCLGAKVPLKCYKGSMKRERRVCLHARVEEREGGRRR